MKYYGIDLGTNNCEISCLEKDNDNVELFLLKDKKGNSNIKSQITLKDINNIEIASTSNKNLKNTYLLMKGKLGSEKSISINNKNISVQFCVALLLNYIRKIDDDIKSAVITVPTFYNQSKRNSTIEAALQAGFTNIKLIEEPTSAAMYHLFKKYTKNEEMLIDNENILIFDFGGGTLDLSLINVKFDENLMLKPQVIAIDGIQNFGGYLIDILLARLIIDIINQNSGLNDKKVVHAFEIINNHVNSYKDMSNTEIFVEDDEINKFIFEVISEAEKAKIQLSNFEKAYINVKGYMENEEISREDFEKLILDNEMILSKILQLLKNFKFRNNVCIDEVILVGGTSQIPKVYEKIKEVFSNSKIINSEEYVNAVAYGAALISAINAGEIIKPFGNNVCTGVLPRSIYIECNGVVEELFKEGTAYPLKNNYVHNIRIPFSLTDNISIRLFEKDEKNRYEISNVKFYHPCFYTGDSIKLNVEIDENGMLKFKAIHFPTMEELEFTSERNNSLNERMIKAGYIHISKNVKYVE